MFINCNNDKHEVKETCNNRLKLLQYITDTKHDYNLVLKWMMGESGENYEISVKTIRSYNIEITDLISHYNSKFDDNIKTDIKIL